MLCLPVPIYTPLPWPGENFPQPDIGAVCPFSGNGAEMQRNTGYFPTESLEPSGNRLFSRSALNEGYLFRGSLAFHSLPDPPADPLPEHGPCSATLRCIPAGYPSTAARTVLHASFLYLSDTLILIRDFPVRNTSKERLGH